ncbi:integral membrane protein MviN [secondary endosymbiont of Heteropsylla cubana]|uniref:Probable lipid II flippase MurJ n=1 Tax=secondary endosymbiont of Heteropsylla cubana TaxID=134287 RepID=J3YSW3_9ENTR|nr:murein biosynthesis integral membrane protein MurJ [secondary endosymbiont of Heteropsylla cubana]AFP85413.1 integral membrane protein MviN [secondary endosymbiont of Heteropsylla cubana]
MSLLKSLVVVSSITFFSRILGLIRDIIIAQAFGAGIASDAFFIAFKIPNMLRRIFAEGTFSQAFVPILAEYKNKQNDIATRTFLAYIAGLLTLILSIVTITGILAAPWIIMVTSLGFSANTSEKFALTTKLLRITFPYIFFVSLTSLASSVLNTWNQFLVPAFTPALLNISMLGFLILGTPLFHPPIMALGWAVVVGGILQLSYQIPFLKKINMLIFPRIKFFEPDIYHVFRKMGPTILGGVVSQISIIINTLFSSFLLSGSVSWMYYADRLMEFPSGVLGATLGTILLPSLSRSIHDNDHDKYSRLLDWALRACLILALPSALGLAILSYPLTVLLFQYGKFSEFDTLMTQKALLAYSVGLVGLILGKVLVPAFYSRRDMKTPLRMAIITLFTTQLMNLMFVIPLKHVGLSLSIGLSSCLNSILLYWQLRRKKLFKPQPGWIGFFFRVLLAVIIMGSVLIGLLIFRTNHLLSIGERWQQQLQLIGIIIVSGVVYFSALWIMGFRLKHLQNM